MWGDFMIRIKSSLITTSRVATIKGTLNSVGTILAYLRDNRVISDDLYHHLNQDLIHGIDSY